jgi:hypothetical protein
MNKGPIPSTECKTCGTPKTPQIKFFGRLCYTCQKQKLKDYYKDNAEKVRKKQLDNYYKKRLEENPNYVHTPQLKLTPDERKTRKRRVRENYRQLNKEQIRYREMQRQRRIRAKQANIRNPRTPNKDSEIYIDNQSWSHDHIMFLNFDYIKYCPIEQLNIKYWINEEKEEELHYKNLSKNYGVKRTEYIDNTTKKYLEPDDESYGRLENGSIRFYPT